MKYDPDIHHRRSIRLREYDYSATGAYFVTICAQGRECRFGVVADGKMHLNDAGSMVSEWWLKLPGKFPGVVLDECTIMPNHFHGIVVINDADTVGAPPCGCPPLGSISKTGRPRRAEKEGQPHGVAPTVGDVLDWFKSMTTNAYIRRVNEHGWPPFPGRLWQRNYYERVIRDERELDAARKYILENPIKWHLDRENPANLPAAKS